MTEIPELNPNNPQDTIDYAKLREQIAALKEAKADGHFQNIDPQTLTDEDLTIYHQLRNKTLKEGEMRAWRSRVTEETKSLPRSYDPIKLPDREIFAAYVVNKFVSEKALERQNNFAK